MDTVKSMDEPGSMFAVYWLESNFGQESVPMTEAEMLSARKRWERAKGWGTYLSACQALWDDLQYFPVAENAGNGLRSVSFEDSWMFDRPYGGGGGNEGRIICPLEKEEGEFR